MDNFYYYFQNDPNLIISSSINRIITFSTFFLIKDVLMQNFIDSKGGAIFIINSEVNIMVRDSIFSYCRSNSNDSNYYSGGAIYLVSTTLSSVLENVCAFYCFIIGTSFRSQFAAIHGGENRNNYWNHVSILRCSPDSSIQRSMSISLLYGNQKIKYINSSSNLMTWESSIFSYQSNSLQINFSSIINCTSNDYITIYLHTCVFNISYSNIINNKIVSYGVLYIPYTYSTIKDSIFINNKGKLIDTSLSYAFNFYNNWIKHEDTIGFNANNNFIGFTNSYQFYHFSTLYCIGITSNSYSFKRKKEKNIRIFLFQFFI